MDNYFLKTLQHLRHYEEVMLYGNLLAVSESQQEEALSWLKKEYENESLDYPHIAPLFDEATAMWAARTIYIAAQLMLYRENKEADLEVLLPSYQGNISPSAILSADLLLRFLPDLIRHLKALDPEDKLVEVLKSQLQIWHYSGVEFDNDLEKMNFDTVISDPCLFQLYIDRVIENKKIKLASHPALIDGIKSSMGYYDNIFWKDFKQLAETNERDRQAE